HEDFIVMDMLSRHHTLKMTQMIATNFTPVLPGEIDNRPQIRQNTLFWNRGDGTYAQIACFAGLEATDWTWTPAFLDVDLDGYEDLLVSNGHAFDTQDLDTAQLPFDRKDRGPAAAVRHLMSFPKLETPNYAFRNCGNLAFEEVGAAWGFNSKQVCHGIIFADLDNDGDLDPIVSSLNAPPLVYRNDSAAPRIQVRLKGKAPNGRGIGAKVEVLGGAVPRQSQQIVCGGRYLSSDDPIRVFAAGTLKNRLKIEVTWRNGTRSLVNEATANHIYEIDEAGAQPVQTTPSKVPGPPPLFREVSSLLNHKHHDQVFDDFARQPLLSKKLSQLGPGVAWMDFDGDGRDELAVGGGRGGALAILRSDGKSGFVKTEVPNITSDDLLGLAPWVSSNGSRSLLVARANYESGGVPSLLKISASGGAITVFTQALPLASSPGPLAVADIDGSGVPTLFVGGRVKAGRYPESVSSHLLVERSDQFVPDPRNAGVLQQAGLVSAAVWSDLNGDGFPELILACEWGPVRIFENERGRLREATKEWKLDPFTGWWTSVTTGDIDGDGRLDIIAGNWGLNGLYRATPQNPLRLYYGDLAGDGSVQLVDAAFDSEIGKLVPRENLTMLAPAMPFLRSKFPSYASFRMASLGEVLGERIHLGQELLAATLASMVFLNRGDHFEAVPLPAAAQWTPVFGISVADVDGDGADDLFLAQNFFATRKEIPRLDAGRGLWLRNDGKGNLHPITAAESGIAVWGEQRGCAVGDFDGDGRVDLAVMQNANETKVFRNEGAKPGLRVRLKGPAGNPDGIGAALRLKYANGAGPLRELHGASGYLSHDSVVAIMGMRAQPTHVAVRWPGGRLTEHPVAPGAKEMVAGFTE
ncbi:MAG TPA: FG-GAP-like repeat-containing protein, partial [Methylomirabilota bacterium]|nr:FG-GAP-like repeat-containing protein [Methylomirabilota bacterium]